MRALSGDEVQGLRESFMRPGQSKERTLFAYPRHTALSQIRCHHWIRQLSHLCFMTLLTYYPRDLDTSGRRACPLHVLAWRRGPQGVNSHMRDHEAHGRIVRRARKCFEREHLHLLEPSERIIRASTVPSVARREVVSQQLTPMSGSIPLVSHRLTEGVYSDRAHPRICRGHHRVEVICTAAARNPAVTTDPPESTSVHCRPRRARRGTRMKNNHLNADERAARGSRVNYLWWQVRLCRTKG